MKIAKVLFFQWLSSFYVAGISIIVVFFLARILGPKEFGVYSYILSLASIYAIIQDGGFKTILYRKEVINSQYSSGNQSELLRLAFGHIFLTTIFGLLLVSILPIQLRFEISLAIICFALITIFSLVSSSLKGKGNFNADALWKMFVRSLTAVAILIVLHSLYPRIDYIFIAWTLALSIALSMPFVRFIWHRPTFKFNSDTFRTSLIFLSINAATVLYFKSDIIVLNYLHDDLSEVGQYAAAHRLLEGIILVMTPVADIAFRSLQLRINDKVVFLNLLYKLLYIMFGFAILIFSIGYWVGGDIILLTFGEQYYFATSILHVLLISLFFILPNYILTQATIAINKEKYYALFAICAAIINIILNILWIPSYGTFGAAIATIVTEGVLCLGLIYILKKYTGKRYENRS